ncbi:hypothetical protein PWG15_36145 (plasmid) [Ensifer adhaerens]|uniref:hypothetical protein n=1 Tax=Sinorhizobium/Ensifer group TaxID=227292 RepID=UPI000FD9B778|nr:MULTISPECIES: hypothetical protein [Sinorhizobium/Ensifer group]RVK16995.1 hypothetical protein CN164_03565 [Sinorhizobium meliloti]WDZ82109.1 hypothetical protein PWG15_36145 [Ensifer adhaerens]
MSETDREKFVRLGTARVNKAIKAIQLIGNLSNKSNYSYEQADVEKIFRALTAEIKACRQKFESGSSQADSQFRLD